MGNLVFYFSGTGNSLFAAKTIAKELGNTEIVSMASHTQYSLKKQYDTIGFVYPTYYWGLPRKVSEFAENFDAGDNKKAYYYSIAVNGGNPVNAVYQLYEILYMRHGIKLSNGQKLQMFSNYVINHDLSEKIYEITKKSSENIVPIINTIKSKDVNSISKFTKIFGFANKGFVKNVSTMDKNYTVNNTCTGCGICREVCPVKNIEMRDNKPQYNHKCEQCLACLHFCPQKAINYKNVTQNRRRYNHPEISYMELSGMNNS